MALNYLRQQSLFDQFGMDPYMGMDPNMMTGYMDDQMTSPSRGALMQQPPSYNPIPTGGAFNPSGFGQNVQMGPPPPIQPMGIDPSRFGRNIQMSPAPPQQSSAPSSDFLSMLDALQKARPFETRASDRFNNLLDNAPERQEPNFMSRLAGAGAYLGNKSRGIPGGYEAQEKAMYAPYYREMMDWTAKTQPFQQAATVENTGNVNERNLMGNFLTAASNRAETAQRADAAREREDTIRARDANNLKIQQERNAILKAKEEGVEFETRGEFIIATYPNGKVVNTGVRTTNFSPFELENLRQKGRMALQGLENAGSAANASIRAGAGTGAGAGKAVDPKDVNIIRQNTMSRLHAMGSPFIQSAEDGISFKMVPPPDDAVQRFEWEKVAREVYPEAFGPDTGGGGGFRPAPPIKGTPGVNMTPLPPRGSNPPPPPSSQGAFQYTGPSLNVQGVPNIPPSTGGGGGLTPQQQQDEQGLREGRLALAQKGGKTVIIPATKEAIEYYVSQKWLVHTPGKR